MIFKFLIERGGAVMWPLLGLCLISIIIISDRIVVLSVLTFSKKELKLKPRFSIKALELIGQISPVIGFLGTVTGIMAAFKGMSLSSDLALNDVSGGMYEALFTTAAGLIISIVDCVFSEIFTWWADYYEAKSCKI